MNAVLLAGGVDPTGMAGLGVDIWVARSLGLHPLPVPTALTVQGPQGVEEVVPVELGLFRRMLEKALLIAPGAGKVGLVPTPRHGEALASLGIPLVVDTPMEASPGGELAGPESYLPLLGASVITPNLPEAEKLLGRPLRSPAEAKMAAVELGSRGGVVLLKGGHLPEPVDFLWDGKGLIEIQRPKKRKVPRGKGCALATAVACYLARGLPPALAAREGLLWFTENYLGVYGRE